MPKKLKLKEYTEKEYEQFCEDNWIEDEESWLYNFIKGNDVHLDINEDTGILTVKVQLTER